jgi:hypothetical protein
LLDAQHRALVLVVGLAHQCEARLLQDPATRRPVERRAAENSVGWSAATSTSVGARRASRASAALRLIGRRMTLMR